MSCEWIFIGIIDVIRGIKGIATQIGKTAGQLLKWTLGFALAWPLAIIAFGLLPHEVAWVVVPIVTLLPVALFIATIFAMDPLILTIGTATTFAPLVQRLLVKLGGIIVIELALGSYVTIVPLSNDRGSIPLLVLILISLLFFHGKMKAVAIVILVIITIGFWTRGQGISALSGGNDQIVREINADYKSHSTICPNPERFDYNDDDRNNLPIGLAGECFHGLITLPVHWGEYASTLSANKGDWVAIWCAGHNEPSRIFYWFNAPTNGELGDLTKVCHDQGANTDSFWVQGRGTLTLTMIREKHFSGIPGLIGVTH
jgi:hypothetical protein